MIGGHGDGRWRLGAAAAAMAFLVAAAPAGARDFIHPNIAGAAPDAITFGADLDGDGDPDEVHIRREVAEIVEEVYPGEFMAFWVFAPLGTGMVSLARLPSPTFRAEAPASPAEEGPPHFLGVGTVIAVVARQNMGSAPSPPCCCSSSATPSCPSSPGFSSPRPT